MRILIVEDERRLADVLCEGLEQLSYIVDVAYDGPNGLASASFIDYDLIIMDRMLPGGMDGAEICQALRAQGVQTPVLLLTARGQLGEKIDGLDSGADDYLVKPFPFQELLARIRALMRRKQIVRSEELVAADLRLNTRTKEVFRADKSIALSAKEYGILEYLMRNKGQVLSKQDIIDHVWDFDADILPSTVEVFMVYLRAKIEKPFDGPKIITTVRGFGYKISNSL